MNLWKECILAANKPEVYYLYNLAVHITSYFLKIVALFNPKIRLFTEGRKTTWNALAQHISPEEKVIWIHACLLYTSPSPRDQRGSRMPSSA